MAAAIGADMAALGVHQGLSPVLDVVRDYRWGRVEETLGEDPYLVSLLGAAYVRGLQGAGVLATLKHFAGYSASRGARNHGPVPMGRRELADVVLPPFEAALRAGAASVMNSYTDVDGVPAAADRWLLTELLREEWGFEGTVVSDYWAVPFLASMHQVAADAEDAGVLALEAGIDVELPDTARLRPAPRRPGPPRRARRGARRPRGTPGAHPEGRARAAGRGLDARRPSVVGAGRSRPRQPAQPRRRPAARGGVGRAARRRDRPAADRRGPAGAAAGWPWSARAPTTPGPSWAATPSPTTCSRATPTSTSAPASPCRPRWTPCAPSSTASRCAYAQGCAVTGDDRSGLRRGRGRRRGTPTSASRWSATSPACSAAAPPARAATPRTCACPACRATCSRRCWAPARRWSSWSSPAARTRSAPYAGRAAALVQAFMPGEEGGPALAGVLSGRVEPSGRLPVQIPQGPGGQPGTYLQPPLGVVSVRARATSTRRRCSPSATAGRTRPSPSTSLRSSADEVPTDGEFTVSVRVRNTGPRAGTEVVQLYLHDPVASVVRPVQLARRLRPGRPRSRGRPRTSRSRVHADLTSFTGRDLRARRARRDRGPDRHVSRRSAPPAPGTVDRPGPRRGARPAARHAPSSSIAAEDDGHRRR